MIDKSSLLKSQGSLYLELIPKDGLFHKMLLLSHMGYLTGWCNLLASLGRGSSLITDIPHASCTVLNYKSSIRLFISFNTGL